MGQGRGPWTRSCPRWGAAATARLLQHGTAHLRDLFTNILSVTKHKVTGDAIKELSFAM